MSLAVRAERALVGALLVEPERLGEASQVRAEDFSDPALREVFTAITAVDDMRRSQTAGFDAEYLHGLVQACPEPGDAAVYARIVAEAGLRRDLAGHTARLSQLSATTPGEDGDHFGRLSQALERHGLLAERLDRPQASAASSTPADLGREDLILADLLQHREMIDHVRDLLFPEYFTDGERRDVYQAMIIVADRGEPLGELTVAWELSRRGPASAVADSQRLSDYLATLSTTAVEPGAALLLGRDLMADVFRAELAEMAADVSGREAGPEATLSRALPPTSPTRTVQPDSPGLIQPPPGPDLGPDGPSMRI